MLLLYWIHGILMDALLIKLTVTHLLVYALTLPVIPMGGCHVCKYILSNANYHLFYSWVVCNDTILYSWVMCYLYFPMRHILHIRTMQLNLEAPSSVEWIDYMYCTCTCIFVYTNKLIFCLTVIGVVCVHVCVCVCFWLSVFGADAQRWHCVLLVHGVPKVSIEAHFKYNYCSLSFFHFANKSILDCVSCGNKIFISCLYRHTCILIQYIQHIHHIIVITTTTIIIIIIIMKTIRRKK